MRIFWLNLPAILVATLAGVAVSWLYHRLFGESSRGRTPPGFILTAAIAQFWFAAVLAGALILAPKETVSWVRAVGSALIIWLAFIVPAVVVTQRYRRMPGGAVAMDCLYWLLMMVVQALVLQAVGLVLPPAA